MEELPKIYALLNRMTQKHVDSLTSHFDVPIQISTIYRSNYPEVFFRLYGGLVTISFSCYIIDDHAHIEAKVLISKASNWNEMKTKQFDYLSPMDFLDDSNPELEGFFNNMFTYIIFWSKNI